MDLLLLGSLKQAPGHHLIMELVQPVTISHDFCFVFNKLSSRSLSIAVTSIQAH